MPHAANKDEVASITLDDGQTVSGQDAYLEVNTESADDVRVYVDDGSTGTKAAQFTLTLETYKNGAIDDWMHASESVNTQSRSTEFTAPTNKARVDLENTSSNNGQSYRIWVEALN